MNTCFHRSSPRRTALAAAAAALLFGAGTAHAGDFREAALTQFIPQPGYPLTDLMLVALTGSQFNYKTWDRSSGHWSAWHPNVYPTPGGSFTRDDRAHFPLVTWYGGGDGGWRTNGYYNADGLGAPWWQEQGSIFSLDLHGQIVDGHGTRFLPGSGIARRTSVQYLHFFGGSVSDPSCRGLGLRERWWDPEAFQWAWAYHGCPSQLAYPTSVGGQSAATTEQVPYSLQHTFVFATVSPSPAEAELWVRHTSTARPYRDAHEPWAWLRLGRPANTTLMDSEPLTVSYDRGNHIWRTHVFVTAKSNVDGLYHLYERYTDGDNWSAFSAWSDHGVPLGLNGSSTADKRFRMSTAVLRHDPGSSLRICLYGSSFHGPAAVNSGQLVEHRWNGSAWVWDQSDSSPERDNAGNPVPLKVRSSAVGRNEQRVSIVSISDTGRLWERVWDSFGNWQWVEHTP